MTDKIDDGGPAFPASMNTVKKDEVVVHGPQGMFLRDWYAGMALQGLCANPHAWEEKTMEEVVNYSFTHADAMIKARKS